MEEKQYIHGYNEIEQQRLISQAGILDLKVFEKLDFSSAKNILEIGSGVGAQTGILIERYPKAKITGVERSQLQHDVLTQYLSSRKEFEGHYEVHLMDATQMSFPDETFDAIYICWVLEHGSDPTAILSEARRVLKQGGTLALTEVQNTNLHLEPHSEFLDNYWNAYNELQLKIGGDPFVGVKIGRYLANAGFEKIDAYPQTFFYDKREPEGRETIVDYWTNLLLSGFDNLRDSGFVQEEDRDKVRTEMEKVKNTEEGVFFYSFMQAQAVK